MQIYGMNSKPMLEILPIYDETLYLSSENGKALEQPILGNFEKKVLVLIREEDHQAVLLEFLQKMLTACRLQLNDYYVLIHPGKKLNMNLLSIYQPETVLLFGIDCASEFFQVGKKRYEPFRFHQQKWLLADTLSVINGDNQTKSMLWTSGLKPLFDVT